MNKREITLSEAREIMDSAKFCYPFSFDEVKVIMKDDTEKWLFFPQHDHPQLWER